MNNQVSERVHRQALAWMDQRGGGRFFDHKRADRHETGLQLSARVDPRLMYTVDIEIDLPLLYVRLAGCRANLPHPSDLWSANLSVSNNVEIYELYRSICQPERIVPLVGVVEISFNPGDVQRTAAHQDGDSVLLAVVSQIGLALNDQHSVFAAVFSEGTRKQGQAVGLGGHLPVRIS